MALVGFLATTSAARAELKVGFADRDITPPVGRDDKPVWLAGYGHNRRAESIHDPIFVRGLVLSHGAEKVAIVSLDVVGLQYTQVQAIRKRLPGYRYVLVASTHNHEGPDVIGIWGQSVVHRGVHKEYLKLLIDKTVETVRDAESKLRTVTAKYGSATDESLVNDSRKPYVKDGALQTISFHLPDGGLAGVLLKWSVHPEALGSRNKELTADYPAWTVKKLSEQRKCPIVLVVGAIGGLLAPPKRGLFAKDGKELFAGSFDFAIAYGEKVADLGGQALDAAKPIRLTPFRAAAETIYVPAPNKYYRAARSIGVLRRRAYAWTGKRLEKGASLEDSPPDAVMAIETEVAYLLLGDLGVPCIPGEIYPELVFNRFQEPVEANVDFPDAAKEPTVVEMTPQKTWMLVGLANDEIGYILPKRQWDQAAPFAYGRKSSQYGEINSCGPDVARVILESLRACVKRAQP